MNRESLQRPRAVPWGTPPETGALPPPTRIPAPRESRRRQARTQTANRSSRAWRRLVTQVIAEVHGICHLCGQPCANSGNHLFPVKYRPDLEIALDNVRAAHLLCNKQRGTRPVPAKPALATTRDW